VDVVVAIADVPSPGSSIVAGSKTCEGSEISADVDTAGCSTSDDTDAAFLATVIRNSGAT